MERIIPSMARLINAVFIAFITFIITFAISTAVFDWLDHKAGFYNTDESME